MRKQTMAKMATVKFTANGKNYSHTFPHSVDTRVDELKSFMAKNKIRKKDIHNCQITIDGWGFWAGFIF